MLWDVNRSGCELQIPNTKQSQRRGDATVAEWFWGEAPKSCCKLLASRPSRRVLCLNLQQSAPVSYTTDAFQKREKANEDYAIRLREKEKLLELKKKLAEQQKHLKQLEAHIDEITKDQGGEHN
ncbi:hypothetical protein BD289DRAFT_155555 [Coniella lustricola]|uniref:ATPase inhibitor, mitochondrial n=1 Tax=Coniella lustricola TaxID=2025994 RepID=A0A2T3AMI4_9PEZI|nr:hypothetical protein BD289DRAFT_155555 [Coniella lustricola]